MVKVMFCAINVTANYFLTFVKFKRILNTNKVAKIIGLGEVDSVINLYYSSLVTLSKVS
jgi:hypothetical protein